MSTCPPGSAARSSTVTACPRSASTRAASRPAGPPPPTTTRCGPAPPRTPDSRSRPRPHDHHALRPGRPAHRVFPLAGRPRIRQTEDGLVLAQEVAALEAGHAVADLPFPPLAAFPRHLGIGVESPAERHEVGVACLEDALGHMRGADPPRAAPPG